MCGFLTDPNHICQCTVQQLQRYRARFAGTPVPHNAAMGVRAIRQHCKLDGAGERLLEQAMQHFGLSARAHDRIRKVARTIADLIGAETITSTHLSEGCGVA